jgi:hypothetical protein
MRASPCKKGTNNALAMHESSKDEQNDLTVGCSIGGATGVGTVSG